jgi:transcriptional regulator with XRE-family HTH domain
MDTFGQKLIEVIESRGLNLEDVAQASGLGIHNLKALERGDHSALPEDESVTEGLQAFARLVDVDPVEVVDDYLRERENYRRTAPSDVEVAVVSDAPQVPDVVMQQTASRSSRSPWLFALGAAALVLVAAGFSWLQFSGRDEPAAENPVSSNAVLMAPGNMPETPDVLPSPAGEMESSAGRGVTPDGKSQLSKDQAQDAAAGLTKPAAPAPQAGTAVMPSGLVIAHHGVGTGVVNHELIGEAERFAEGTQVWFWTWVEGATSGQAIRHVWIHEGQEALSVSLRLGGARWRTQSYKNLHSGTTGNWVVEARDEAGRVLARRNFQSFRPATD